jgi:hypothetical protein
MDAMVYPKLVSMKRQEVWLCKNIKLLFPSGTLSSPNLSM